MSRNGARMLAAGFVSGGFVTLALLAFQLTPGEFVLLGLGVGCLVAATYINTATSATSSGSEASRSGVGEPDA